MITVLRDEDGDSLPVYLDAFAGEKTEDRVEITLDKRPLHEGEMRLLGFGERLPEESSIQEFLASCGVPDEEVPQV